MKRALLQGLLLPALSVLVPISGFAEWRLSGSNTLRFDAYRVDGDRSQGLYAEQGLFGINDLDLSLSGTPGPGRSLRVDFAGTLTDSPYRSDEQGLVPEVMRLSYADDAARLPFRVDLGDQNVALSPLTLERTLKAARLGVRPRAGANGRKYAIDAFVGTDGQSWRGLDLDEGLYQGLGVSVSDPALGTLGANLVHYSAERIEQTVASAYLRRQFELGGQRLNVGGEWGWLHGNPSAGAEAVDAQGGFFQLEGASATLPLNYRVRYDRYGEHFSPQGGVVIADSEAYFGEAGWRLDSGATVSGRLSRLTEWRSSANPVATDTAVVRVDSPIGSAAPARGSLQVEAQTQRRHDREGWVDSHSESLRVGLEFAHANGGSSRVDAAVARVEDDSRWDADRRSWQVSAAHRAEFEIGGIGVTLTPGLIVGKSRGEDGTLRVGPTLALEAARERHRLALEIGRSEFDGADPAAGVDQSRLALRYEHQRGRHRFGVDLDRELRKPEQGADTDAWRAGVYWRYEFDQNLGGAG